MILPIGDNREYRFIGRGAQWLKYNRTSYVIPMRFEFIQYTAFTGFDNGAILLF